MQVVAKALRMPPCDFVLPRSLNNKSGAVREAAEAQKALAAVSTGSSLLLGRSYVNIGTKLWLAG